MEYKDYDSMIRFDLRFCDAKESNMRGAEKNDEVMQVMGDCYQALGDLRQAYWVRCLGTRRRGKAFNEALGKMELFPAHSF